MKFTGHVYKLPKAGNTEDEYEDAYALILPHGDHPSDGTSRYADTLRAAIADGATESILAKSWAQYLVQEYVREPFSTVCELQQRRISENWHTQQRNAIGQKPAHLHWCLQEGLVHGADATFLGVSIVPHEGRWKYVANAVGDCNLFHIRGQMLLKAFPLEKPEDFNFTPFLLNSRNIKELKPNHPLDPSSPTFQSYEAECQEGDELWLMTDALACWFLRRAAESSEAEAIQQVQKIYDEDNHHAFEELIEKERKHRRLRNDDVTWMIIQLLTDSTQDVSSTQNVQNIHHLGPLNASEQVDT
jgi:hypothetical protein